MTLEDLALPLKRWLEDNNEGKGMVVVTPYFVEVYDQPVMGCSLCGRGISGDGNNGLSEAELIPLSNNAK